MSNVIERLRRDVSLTDTAISCGVDLQKNGHEWEACCPFHAEDTASFTIYIGDDHVQRYWCFGCGERGDVVDFVRGVKGVDTREAIKILGGGKVGPNVQPKQVKVRNIYEGITPLDPVAAIEVGKRIRLFNPKRAGTEMEWGNFTPSMVFPYRRTDGSLLGYVLRREFQDGGKEAPMVMWCRLRDGSEAWCRFPFPKPRPLYGLDKVGDARQVIIVEGEKCRDALASAVRRTAVSWPGGTQGVRHTDWSPLAGRNVVIWPDADAPGRKTAGEIATILADLNCTVRTLDI